ncbi:hypothetical protein EVAR_60671_1 [Eumeta japonica]|uniref:Uncharacterized protein n=1 Tax=Eumeta variegata TaxID=151549 RepID=A0A4C1ZQS1_EUMVA|nr:hypothetical protein EVAR_60671_1 [Eumeta japonica]
MIRRGWIVVRVVREELLSRGMCMSRVPTTSGEYDRQRKDPQSTMHLKDTSANLAATLKERHLGRSGLLEDDK